MNPLVLQLRALVKFLAAQKIPYVILGGVAVSIYGEPRLTADIDVNIILDKRRIMVFLDRAKKYGFYPALSDIEKFAGETGVMPMIFRRNKITGKFDIILAENTIEYIAIQRGRTKSIGTLRARFVSPEDLIIHKITSSRPRDLEDLKGILIRQSGKLDIEYIRYWLKKIDKVNRQSRLLKLFEKLRKDL